MKKPTKCTTPKKDREAYKLTVKDIRNLTALINEANDILSYYILMPENRTGELTATDNDQINALYQAVEELHITLDTIDLSY